METIKHIYLFIVILIYKSIMHLRKNVLTWRINFFRNPAMIAIITFSTYKLTYNPSSGHERFAMSFKNDCTIFFLSRLRWVNWKNHFCVNKLHLKILILRQFIIFYKKHHIINHSWVSIELIIHLYFKNIK